MTTDTSQEMNRAIQLYVDGGNINEISTKTNVPTSSIYAELMKRNIPTRCGNKHLTVNDIEDICKLFKSGVTRKELALKFGYHKSSITNVLAKQQLIGNIYLSEELSQKIVTLYESNVSLSTISKMLNISMTTIHNHCKNHGLLLRNVGGRFDLEHPDFFETLTAESAYMLGIFIADGCLMTRKHRHGVLSFGLNLDDEYMVKNFQKLLGSPHKIRYYNNMASITITNQRVYNSITALGIPGKRKTYNLDECKPLFDKLSETTYERDFIRGFLDGDGSIHYSPKKAHSVSFTAYSKKFLESIDKCIIRNVKVTNGYFISVGNSWRISYGGRNKVTKILKWIYESTSGLCLLRKKEKWDKICELNKGLLQK
jgi:hypothetical protein